MRVAKGAEELQEFCGEILRRVPNLGRSYSSQKWHGDTEKCCWFGLWARFRSRRVDGKRLPQSRLPFHDLQLLSSPTAREAIARTVTSEMRLSAILSNLARSVMGMA